MNIKFLHSFLAISVSSIVLVSCQSQETETVNQESVVSEEAPEESIEKIDSNVVFNANLASEEDLKLTRLSSELIEEILTKRPFLTMNSLDSLLNGVTNKEELYRHLFVPINLNTTPESDFLLIPGVGKKMAHEFEEYRPYKSIKQFRKEIGKYVDEEEVARYENYVFVPVELNSASEEDIKALPGIGEKMAHEFEEYRPYSSMKQFEKEIGKYVDDRELKRLSRLVFLKK